MGLTRGGRERASEKRRPGHTLRTNVSATVALMTSSISFNSPSQVGRLEVAVSDANL